MLFQTGFRMKFIQSNKWINNFFRILYFLKRGWNNFIGHGLELKDVFSEFHKNMWLDAASKLSVDIKSYSGGFYKATYKGRSTWIVDYRVEIDNYPVLQVARNKPLVNKILSENGFVVPAFHSFMINNIESAKEFLDSQQAPCVVKPALDGAGGQGVTTHIKSSLELKRAAIFASVFCPIVMIERLISGDVYRLLFLNGELLDAIRRFPPQVIGDGYSTIRNLINKENKRRIEQSGFLSLKVLIIDFDCKMTLRRSGLSLKDVPKKGQTITIKSTTNESGANDCESVINIVNDDIVTECRRAASLLGIKLAGVDIITSNIESPLKQTGGKIIEINAIPGLHYHYQVRNSEDMVPVAVPILSSLLNINKTERIDYANKK